MVAEGEKIALRDFFWVACMDPWLTQLPTGYDAKYTLPARKCHRQVVDLVRAFEWYLICQFECRRRGTGRMWKVGQSRWLGCWVALALVLTVGCSRRVGVPAGDAGKTAVEKDKGKELPFHQDAEAGTAGGAEPSIGTQESGQNPDSSGLPFRATSYPSLPAGTLLTVRLGVPLSSAEVGANRAFSGVIDEEVVIDGNALVPPGAKVLGRVEGARSADGGRKSGYVRLTLDSITIDRRQTTIHTASLFARGDLSGSPGDGALPRPQAIRLEKGHRLIFRLTAPATPAGPDIGVTSTALPNAQ